MGYESKIYIVSKTTTTGFNATERMFYAEKIAEFKMGKFHNLANRLRDKPITDCFIYADDGDTQIIEDRYGKPLTETTPQFVIDLLEELIADGETYRRVYPLLACLKAFEEHKQQWGEEIAVLHYGY